VLATLGTLVVFSGTAHAAPTLIDFESFASGGQASNFLAGEGISSVTISRAGTPESPTVWVESGGANPVNPGNGNFMAGVGNSTSGTRVMTIVFSTSLESFSFRRIDLDGLASAPPVWTAVAKDSGGTVLDTVGESFGGSFLLPASDASFSLVAAPGTIASVEITTNANLSTFGTVPLDDFALLIPEPSSAMLTATGLLGLGLRRRRGAGSRSRAPR
jgi:hypothetical protein